MDNRNPELTAAVQAALAAGKILREWFSGVYTVQYKGSIDVVTEADRLAEEKIIDILRSANPGHGFVTEEHGIISGRDGYRWVIDPLDGTVNFIHRNPRFAVSIGLEHHGRPVLGVIYNPILDELFTAIESGGAFLNGTTIQVSTTQDFKRALLNTGFPYDSWENENNNTRELAHLVRQVMSIRSTGSCALDLCDVACGRTDGYWDIGLYPYDLAAGTVIAREAGGRVTNADGDEDNLFHPSIVAANPAIHSQLLEHLHSACCR